MQITCSGCGHGLRAEAGSIGTFVLVDFFDDKLWSDSFGERVTRCPGCDLWLYYDLGIEPSDVTQA